MLAIELISSGLSLQGLGVRLGFPTRDWAGSLQWKHKILGTSPVVSGKGPGLWLCRKEFLQRQKVVKQVFIEEKEYNTCGETPGQTPRESLWVTPAWQFKSLTWGTSSGFHLASHFALPGSQPMFGISQDPLTCALASVGQMDFTTKSSGQSIPWHCSPFGLRKAFSVPVCSGRPPDFENAKYVVWAGPNFLS